MQNKTIPTYRDLENRIAVLEGKLSYWSNLDSFDEAKPYVDKVLDAPEDE